MIFAEAVRKSFEGRDVLRGIDLTVDQGEVLAVMGSSGGGKTTLLRCIAGLIPLTSGRVTVEGFDISTHTEKAREKMGFVFQSAALFDYMNVRENLLFGVRRKFRLTPKEEEALVARVLDDVELEGAESKMPSELSGGMRKRVGLARALALDPVVILYDEPTTGLDPITTYAIDQLIVKQRDRHQVASILVSHDVSSVLRVADRVMFLEGGEATFVGTAAEFAEADHGAIRELVDKARAVTL